MRLFIAIDFDNDTKDKIYKLQKEAKEYSIKGRWKYIDNFHLTLKFLGEVSPNAIGTIDKTLKNICANIKPFSIGIDKVGYFEGQESIRVLWLGIKGDMEKLYKLNGQIEEQFEKIEFVKEKRKYSPHITIAQDVIFNEKFENVQKLIETYSFNKMLVDKIVLMESQEIDRKRVYTIIGEYELKN